MSLRAANKRLVALEASAQAELEQAQREAFDLLSDAELERLADGQERRAWAEMQATWLEVMSLSPERQEKSTRLLWLNWLNNMSKAINQR